jgi:hypothetical protein
MSKLQRYSLGESILKPYEGLCYDNRLSTLAAVLNSLSILKITKVDIIPFKYFDKGFSHAIAFGTIGWSCSNI